MHFRIEQHFAAPLDEVAAAYRSPELLAYMATLPNVGGAELVDERTEGEHLYRRIRYRFTGQLNSAVTAVVDPDRLTWVEESDTDLATQVTTWHITPDHYASRITCAGTFALAAAGEGAKRVTDADIKVHFPLVGGRVERAIVSGLREHAEAEEAAITTFLAR